MFLLMGGGEDGTGIFVNGWTGTRAPRRIKKQPNLLLKTPQYPWQRRLQDLPVQA